MKWSKPKFTAAHAKVTSRSKPRFTAGKGAKGLGHFKYHPGRPNKYSLPKYKPGRSLLHLMPKRKGASLRRR